MFLHRFIGTNDTKKMVDDVKYILTKLKVIQTAHWIGWGIFEVYWGWGLFVNA